MYLGLNAFEAADPLSSHQLLVFSMYQNPYHFNGDYDFSSWYNSFKVWKKSLPDSPWPSNGKLVTTLMFSGPWRQKQSIVNRGRVLFLWLYLAVPFSFKIWLWDLLMLIWEYIGNSLPKLPMAMCSIKAVCFCCLLKLRHGHNTTASLINLCHILCFKPRGWTSEQENHPLKNAHCHNFIHCAQPYFLVFGLGLS